MTKNRLMERLKREPETVFELTVGFLLISFALVVAIDIYDVMGLRTTLTGGGGETPGMFFWFYWFRIPVEAPIQWILLCTATLLFISCTVAAHRRDQEQQKKFALYLSLGLVLMVMEDIFDVRHAMRDAVELSMSVTDGEYGLVGTLFELGFFALLGGLLVFVFVRYRSVFWGLDKVRRYMIRGYVFYALAVGSSWMGSAFSSAIPAWDNLYSQVGNAVLAVAFKNGGERERIYLELDAWCRDEIGYSLGFYFMDWVYEESLEMLGAAALVVAGISFLVTVTDSEDEVPEEL